MNDFFIWINNLPVAVSETVYKTYWKGQRKERYFAESDIHNKVFYYNALDTEETNGSDIFLDEASPPVDEQVIQNMEISRLHNALKKLSDSDYALIYRLYFYGTSLRTISREDNIPLSTLHYRHQRILKKLKDILCTSDNL